MRNTIKGKIIGTNILIVTVALLIFTFVMNYAVTGLLEREIKSNLESERKIMATIVVNQLKAIRNTDNLSAKTLIRTEAMANRTPLESQFEIYVRRKNENISIVGENEFLDEELNGEILSRIESKNFNDLFTYVVNNRTYYFTVSRLLQNNNSSDTSFAWVVQYTQASLVQNASQTLRRISFLLLLLLVAIASLLGYRRGKSIADPINKLKSRAEQIAKRNYHDKLSISTGDEIEDLAQSMEVMADQLDSYDTSQKQFIQNITHELKTPLTSIQGYAEGIKDGVFHDESKSLDIIIDESKRLKNLVNQIIFLSKLESFNDFYDYSWESIEDLAKTSIEKVQGYAMKKKVTIKIDMKDDLDLECDKDKIVQALLNILSNSVKFAKSTVFVEGQKDHASYTLRIFDDGEGFSEKDLLNAFQRFYKGGKGDTGLGLTITNTIINKTGGTLSIRNKEGYGGEYIIKFES